MENQEQYTIFIERPNFGIASEKVKEILEKLEQENLAKIIYPNKPITQENLGEELEKINPHIVIAAPREYTGEIMSRAPNLIAVIRHGIGVDSIDFNYCKEKNIYLINTPNAPSKSVAYDVLEKILLMLSNSPQTNQKIKEGEWPIETRKDPRNITVGLIGAGRIPLAFAEISKNLGFKKIIAFDIFDEALERIEKLGVETTKDLNKILTETDIISMHTPLNEHTHHLISEKEFEIIGDNKMLINTSRGGTVKTEALINWLNNNPNSKAALDVLEQEPPNKDNSLLQLPIQKLYLTPHLGASTDKGLEHMAEGCMIAADAIIRNNGLIKEETIQELQTTQPDNMFNIVINREK
jgi:D-3-phosphoglycerate dehydrogenase / 2-oxoglutarate reductase